jgi:hypothetical protein
LKTLKDIIQFEYKAAIVALDNFIIDFPGTTRRCLVFKIDSAYQLGIIVFRQKWKND